MSRWNLAWLLGIAALVSTFVCQLFLSAAWPPSVFLFDLPLLVVLYYAVDSGPVPSLMLGTGVGFLQDSLTGSLLGVGSVARGFVGWIVGAAGLRFILTRPSSQLLVFSAGTLAVRLLELAIHVAMGRQTVLPRLPDLLAGAVGNTLVGWTASMLLRREKVS